MSDNELLTRALCLAAEKHMPQKRRNGEAYIYHPIKVCELVKDAGFGVDYQITALFHDLLEDTDTAEETIAEYGEHILEAVKLLTRAHGADEAEYVAAILANPMATAVKNADKVNNLWDCVYCSDKEWAKHYVEKSRRYYWKKFSAALDDALENVEEMLSVGGEWERNIPCYTAEDMALYEEM